MDREPTLLEEAEEMRDLCHMCMFCGECECCELLPYLEAKLHDVLENDEPDDTIYNFLDDDDDD